MSAAVLHHQFASLLASPLSWQDRREPEFVPTGIAEIDSATGGLPRGALTEIVGPACSGRTTMLHSILAGAAAREEACALVDAGDAFCPHDAALAGAALDRLLWVRCAHNAEHALKAVDLLIQGGGFGLVVLDLGDTPPAMARRISLTSWFRLRRAVEHTPTVFVALARQSNARTCASLVVECSRARACWSGARGTSRLLRSARFQVSVTRRSPWRGGMPPLADRQDSRIRQNGHAVFPGGIQCTPVFTAAAI
ncbi:MAG: hypothetical protein JST11_30600 [Acidobacteria bacterium]|nr:hypothetical protein [Acidobacteriota bacterium]